MSPQSRRPSPVPQQTHGRTSGMPSNWSRGRCLLGELLAPWSPELQESGWGLLLPRQAVQLEDHRPAPEPGMIPEDLTQSLFW